jgi:hypothetical protein
MLAIIKNERGSYVLCVTIIITERITMLYKGKEVHILMCLDCNGSIFQMIIKNILLRKSYSCILRTKRAQAFGRSLMTNVPGSHYNTGCRLYSAFILYQVIVVNNNPPRL